MKYHVQYLFIFCSACMLTSCNFSIDDNLDSDGDGVLDKFDNCRFDPEKIEPGVCGCNIPENTVTINGKELCIHVRDGDRDGDGIEDDKDSCPDKPFKYAPDVCGCDRYDEDRNQDGIIDACEKLDDDEENKPYMPENGFPDQCPDDPEKLSAGICGCGIKELDRDDDGYIDACGEGGPNIDVFPDKCPFDRNKHLPGICGCGTPDTDNDGDTTPDCIDDCPEDSNKTKPGICECGTLDTDSDRDDVPDCIDECPDDPNKAEPGHCGCGTPDNDDDNDEFIFCGNEHPKTQDHCPDDQQKQEPGSCGCGKVEDTTDSDGDGTPDCIDECPYDPLQTEPGPCGCNRHAIIEKGSDKAVCPQEGGLLSLDTMFPPKNNHVKETPEELKQYYETRTTPNHDIYAYFIPGGNLLENQLNTDPCLIPEKKEEAVLTKNDAIAQFMNYRGEIEGPRPFPQHCVFIFHDDAENDNRTIAYTFNEYYNSDVTIRLGVLGASTTKGNKYKFSIKTETTKDDIEIESDKYDFSLATTTTTLPVNQTEPPVTQQNYTVAFTAEGYRDDNDGTGTNSAAIQGFQVFIGDPEVRFLEQNSDGKWEWPEEEDWSNYDNSTMWRRRVILPEGYGKRCVYMQTRIRAFSSDPYTYYETSNCIDVKAPNRDAHLQVEVNPNEDVKLYYLPGTNMLDDYDFAKSEENPWVFDGEYEINRENEAPPSRTFTSLPELVMKPGAIATQWIKLSDAELDTEPCQVSFWSDEPSDSKITATFTMYNSAGLTLKEGIKSIQPTMNKQYPSYYLNTTLQDHTRNVSILLENKGETDIRIQAPRIGMGKTYVRFSNNRQYWSRWEDATGVKTNWKFENGETIQSEYDCPPSESECTVYAQFTDAVTRAYSEASAVVEFSPTP